jgi:hypothetical protein
MKLNLGCGHRKLDGWLNVDHSDACGPDLVCDLEARPWPWPDDSVEAVEMRHILEHLGGDTGTFLGIIAELWRVCADGATVTVVVPHPRHDAFLVDPTHVRPVLPQTLEMFSQRRNREWIAAGNANTPLGTQMGVDFDLVGTEYRLDEPWHTQFASGALNADALNDAVRRYNNVIAEIEITLRAIKPAGGSA